MTENKTPQEKLIEKFKDEPFSIIDEQGTILNKTHLSSMGYATHVPYSVVGLYDLLTSINKLAHEKDELEKKNEQLKQQVEDLYESDKSLRKFASNMTLNYTGICVPRRLFDEVLNILKDMEHNDLVEDLSKESIDTSANGC